MATHDWVDAGKGMVTCTLCPVEVTRVVRDMDVVPCSPDNRCPASYSMGHHEITTDGPEKVSCLFCGTVWSRVTTIHRTPTKELTCRTT